MLFFKTAAFKGALCILGLLACGRISLASHDIPLVAHHNTVVKKDAETHHHPLRNTSPGNGQPMLRLKHSTVQLVPASFLPGVSPSVQITCLPPTGEDIAQLIMLQLYRTRHRVDTVYMDPVATYVTIGSPVLETLGQSLGASVSGNYNASDPSSALLRVDVPQPTDAVDGRYACSVETLDSHGLVHRYEGSAPLTSLAKNSSVPQFYHTVLQELRRDLDILSVDLTNVTGTQSSLHATDKDAEYKILAITNESSKAQSLINDIKSLTNDVDQQVTYLRSEINRLHDITPDSPVSFYTDLTSSYITPSNRAPIVFNSLRQHTDNGYSASTGVFTAPVNGTYRFITGITGYTNTETAASITVNGRDVTSLFNRDDYQLSQATAHVVVQLAAGDEIRVVKKAGGKIYGVNNGDHITYFTGMLLW